MLVGKDVAEILGHNEPNKAIVRHVDEDDRTKYPITDNLGRTHVDEEDKKQIAYYDLQN